MRRRVRGMLLAMSATIAGTAGATVDCRRIASAMEHMICNDPALAARDEAISILYAAALRTPAAPRIRAEQRDWLHRRALSCGEPTCLAAAYDEQTGALLQGPAGRSIARRFHWERGESNGDLTLLLHGGWLTVDIVHTDVGAGGSAGGDVGQARATFTARLSGSDAVGIDYASGCRVHLRRVPAGWLVRQQPGCDFGTASLDALYRPAGR